MTSGGLPVAGWAAFVIALGLMAAFGFGLDTLPSLLLIGAGSAALAAAAVATVAERRRPHDALRSAPEVLVTGSAATTLACVGVMLALVGGVTAGSAYFFPGVVLTLLSVAGLVREHRAARRLLADAEDTS